jgi:hypothetical protein
MKPMSAARSPLHSSASRVRGARAGLLRWAAFCAVGLAMLLGAAPARADTKSPLPKGYTSDERPAAGQGDGWVVGEGDPRPAQDSATPQPAEPSGDEFQDTDPRALDEFHEPLAPYGQWVDDPTYGTVWTPSDSAVGADFAPYQTAGHWTLTDDDQWYWASDYDWGYIPFHYGRWVWINGRGWSWIPGRVYAPAWVTWRVGDYGYIGWAPLPPAWYWWGGVAVTLWAVPPAAYCFVPTTYVFHHHVTTYIVRDRTVVQNAASHTRPYTAAHPQGHSPAQPTPGGKSPASPAPSGGHAARTPASPSVKDAHVPPSAQPASRVRPDQRAVQLARPSTAPTYAVAPSRRGVAGSHGASPGSRGSWDSRPSAGPSRRGFDPPSGPAARGPSSFPSDPGSRGFSPRPPASSFRPSAPSTPSFRPSAPSPSFRPSAPSTPSFRPSAPSPSFRPSTPSFRPSAPSPSFRPSTPSFRPSTPSRPSGRGGRR